MCNLFCKECPKPCGSKRLGENSGLSKTISAESTPLMLISSRRHYGTGRIKAEILKNFLKNRGPVNSCGTSVTIIPGMSDHLKSFQLDSLNPVYDIINRRN